MAQVTVELGRLLTRTDFELFDFDYQFDDPEFKKQIEERIIDYFYDYEIGSETPDMFKRKFKSSFLRVIDYYNQLYNTTLLQYNPLINSKMSEALKQLANTSQKSTTDANTSTSGTRTDNLTATQNGSNTTEGNQKASDYPQQPIAGGQYLAGEEDSVSTTEFDSTSRNTGTVTDKGSSSSDANTTTAGQTDSSYHKTIEGLTGTTYQELIRQERENLLRIPQMIIGELKPCFIMIY